MPEAVSRAAPTADGTSAAGAGKLARLNLLVALRLAEFANALGLNLSLSSLRVIGVVGAALSGLVVFGASSVGAGLAVDLLGPTAVMSYPVTALILAMVYSGIAALLGELLSRFRYSVSGHANRALFRALDIPATLVFLVYAAPRTAVHCLFWALVGLGSAVGLTVSGAIGSASVPGPLVWIALFCTPVALGLVTTAVGLLNASRPADAPPRRTTLIGLSTLAGSLAGAGTTYWLVLPGLSSAGEALLTDGHTLLVPGAVGSTAVLAVGAATTAALWRRLRSSSFRTTAAWTPTYRLRLPGGLILAWTRMLSAQRLPGWRYRVELRVLGAVLGICAAVIGARFAGLPPLTAWGSDDAMASAIEPTIGFISVMFGLTVSELVLGDLGPYAYGQHLRHAIESGVPVRAAVLAQAFALALPVVTLSTALGVGMTVLLGRPVATPLIVGLGTLGAAVVAAYLFPPPRAADGTPTESLFTGIATLLLAALPIAVPLTFPAASPWFTPVGAALLTGGAIVCLRRQLTCLS